MVYRFKSETSLLLRIFRMSLIAKKKAGWERSGAGFLHEEIISISIKKKGLILLITTTTNQELFIEELNVRETEECIKWLAMKQWQEQKPK